VVKLLFTFLCFLQILNLFWFWLMLKGALRRLTETKEDRKSKQYMKVE
jgi:hypothetical protein